MVEGELVLLVLVCFQAAVLIVVRGSGEPACKILWMG
jgi:hypothetical protein